LGLLGSIYDSDGGSDNDDDDNQIHTKSFSHFLDEEAILLKPPIVQKQAPPPEKREDAFGPRVQQAPSALNEAPRGSVKGLFAALPKPKASAEVPGKQMRVAVALVQKPNLPTPPATVPPAHISIFRTPLNIAPPTPLDDEPEAEPIKNKSSTMKPIEPSSPDPTSPEPQPEQPFFIPSAQFVGARSGYVFKMGPWGVGYYMDKPMPAHMTATATTSSQQPEPPSQSFFDELPESFKRRRRGDELAQFIDVVAADLASPLPNIIRPDATAPSNTVVPAPTYMPGKGTVEMTREPTRTQKRKHQLNWLAQNYNANRHVLEERNASGMMTKRQAWGKYGW